MVYGDATYSAMAKTVGYPAAIAAKMILDGGELKKQFGGIVNTFWFL